MIRGATVLAAVLVLSATGASAKDDDDKADTEAVSEDAAKEKKICRTEKMTGSLTRRTRICLTEAQWKQLNDRTRRGYDEMVGNASGGAECATDRFGGC